MTEVYGICVSVIKIDKDEDDYNEEENDGYDEDVILKTMRWHKHEAFELSKNYLRVVVVMKCHDIYDWWWK